MMLSADDHSLLIIETDKDKNSIVQPSDGNNIVGMSEYAENMLIHRQIKKRAKFIENQFILIKKLNEFSYIS